MVQSVCFNVNNVDPWFHKLSFFATMQVGYYLGIRP